MTEEAEHGTERLVMDVETTRAQDWYRFGSVTADEPPAMLKVRADGQEAYAFGWYADRGPCVWHTSADRATLVDQAGDDVLASGFDIVATEDELRLTPAIIDIGGIKARFTYQPAA